MAEPVQFPILFRRALLGYSMIISGVVGAQGTWNALAFVACVGFPKVFGCDLDIVIISPRPIQVSLFPW